MLVIATALLAALAALAAALFALRAARAAETPRAPEVHPEVFGRLAALERELEKLPRDFRADFAGFRQELKQELIALSTGLQTRLAQSEQAQAGQLRGLREEQALGRKHSDEALERHVTTFGDSQSRRLSETNGQMKELRERTEGALTLMGERVEAFARDSADKHEALREQVRGQLDGLRQGNEKKLDEMRGVVDEKLSATLEARLGEKFKTVSDHLEAVHKGLGEMQSLATGVGDLKRVLTNVKSRGGWGELRLGQLLEDMLTADQYEAQVAVRSGAGERVDYAIKLPGRGDDAQPVWLPIDCKFPQEDYERLQAAQDRGDAAEVEACAQALERAVRLQAKSIAGKYVHPPQTTPFAVLYLPTEGLFAEVVRRPGLASALQAELNVMVTGPTTLAAILASLQMGFRTLAVEKRSADVWKTLGEVKTEFRKYGEVWSKLGQKLDDAQKLHGDISTRTRQVEKRLRRVEETDAPDAVSAAEPLFALTSAPARGDDDEAEAA